MPLDLTGEFRDPQLPLPALSAGFLLCPILFGVGLDMVFENFGDFASTVDRLLTPDEKVHLGFSNSDTIDVFLHALIEARLQLEDLKSKTQAGETFSMSGWCKENRAVGRGPCGACALCCKDLREELETLKIKHGEPL